MYRLMTGLGWFVSVPACVVLLAAFGGAGPPSLSARYTIVLPGIILRTMCMSLRPHLQRDVTLCVCGYWVVTRLVTRCMRARPCVRAKCVH